MGSLVGDRLRVKESAGVIVYLKADVPKEECERVKSHFVQAPNSQVGALAAASGVSLDSVSGGYYFPKLGILLGTVDRTALSNLRSDMRVRRVAGAPPLRIIRPVSAKAAKLTSAATWGLKRLRIKALWDQGLDGSGVAVGHLDTGVDGKHAALKQAIGGFVEFDFLGRRKSPTPAPYDSDDHGTHTAATIAGRPVGGKHVGVAPGAELYSALVIEGGHVLARVLGGMEWAIGKKVRVLSMSLGFIGYWDEFLELTKILRARGVLPAFAVGNEGPGSSRSPGNYAEALSVGAMDRQSVVPDFSSSERFSRPVEPVVPDLVAPGVEVLSAKPGGAYQKMSGTSMATPHVAGLAALLWQAQPEAAVDQVEQAILGSCEPLKGVLPERQGRGVPNAKEALKILTHL